MFEFLTKLFDTTDFPPRWYCGNWTEGHGWLHIVSDSLIGAAYAAIPLLIMFFALRRRDLPVMPVFVLFALFIFFCGFGHVVEATLFWIPAYRFAGLIKMVTAAVSWLTVFALIPLLPRLLAFPHMAAVNKQLENEIQERRDAESKLQAANEDLRVFLRNVLGRETRIQELKQEVNALLGQLGLKPRYAESDKN